MPSRRKAIAALLCIALPDGATAQNKPVSLLIAYPSGGPADLIARTVGELMAQHTGRAVVVDSRPGAGGQIAASALLQAPADGQTLLIGDIATLGTNRVLYKNFRYDPVVDFDAVAPMLVMPMALFVPKSSPHDSLRELIAAAKTKPLNFASQGVGSTGHLLAELLRSATGGQFNHVPYRGSAPAVADLIGGHVDFLFEGVGPALPHVVGQRLKALAVAGPQRLAQLASVPTTGEEGLPGVALSVWFGVVARAGTPARLVDALHQEITHAMNTASAAKRFGDLGFESMTMSSHEFQNFIRSEADRWGRFIRQHNIVVD